MRGFITRRFPWLKSDHPLVVRDSRRINRELPKFLRKLTDPWTMLGYAALVHGAFFALSLVGFQRLIFGMSDLFLPFLTPFGTPLVAAFLHSVLYWALMIGLANYSTYLIASDVSTGTWEILRLTPYSSSTILGAKLVASARVWGRVFRALLITRLIAVLILPAAIVFQQQANEGRSFATLDFVAALIFIAQPLVDGLLVLGLSTVAAFAIRSTAWARIGAYGLVAVVYGALSGIC